MSSRTFYFYPSPQLTGLLCRHAPNQRWNAIYSILALSAPLGERSVSSSTILRLQGINAMQRKRRPQLKSGMEPLQYSHRAKKFRPLHILPYSCPSIAHHHLCFLLTVSYRQLSISRACQLPQGRLWPLHGHLLGQNFLNIVEISLSLSMSRLIL